MENLLHMFGTRSISQEEVFLKSVLVVDEMPSEVKDV